MSLGCEFCKRGIQLILPNLGVVFVVISQLFSFVFKEKEG